MLCLLTVLLPLSGCNTFGNGKIVKQLQGENERLLSEFRAERKRREDAERKASLAENRLAEAEKYLARQLQSPSGRLSSRSKSDLPNGNTGFVDGFGSQSTGFGGQNTPADSSPQADASGFRWQRRIN